jgi:FkbM family methyltransferase
VGIDTVTKQLQLAETRRAWAEGELDKHAYISQMYRSHAELFSYSELLADSDIEKIEITRDGVVLTWRDTGVSLGAVAGDERITPIEALNFGRYERDETAMMQRIIRDGNVVWDVGANHGFYSATFARRYPNVRVEAFEPVPRTFAALQRNIERNRVSPQVHLHQHGLSDHSGEATFYFYGAGSGNGSLRDLSGREDVEEYTVQLRVVDDLVAEGVPAPDFMKIDVEGAELLVLHGAMRTLRQTKAPVFAELLRKWAEPFGYHPQDVLTLMSRIGYRCFTIHGDALFSIDVIDDDTMETNFLFLHPDRPAVQPVVV